MQDRLGKVGMSTTGAEAMLSRRVERATDASMSNMFERLKAYRDAPKEARRLGAELLETKKELKRCQKSMADAVAEPFDARNVVWVFGAGRTGSTWLSNMMKDLPGFGLWPEPQLGQLFDAERFGVGEPKARHWSFCLSPDHKQAWLPAVRLMILAGVRARLTEDGVIIKEPHGSAAAPALVEALPESRVVLLVRDPRDTVASAFDAFTRGIWKTGWRGMYAADAEEPDALVENAARAYARHMGEARRAYALHGQSKTVVRYEDLRKDTLSEMERLCSELGISVERKILTEIVDEYSWEGVSEDEKGEGKFHRKATPGGWKEDLTPEQVAAVEEICAPVLEEFYS